MEERHEEVRLVDEPVAGDLGRTELHERLGDVACHAGLDGAVGICSGPVLRALGGWLGAHDRDRDRENRKIGKDRGFEKFSKKNVFFSKKKCFVFSKKTFFLGEWNKGGPGAPDPQKDRGVAQMNGRVTTVEEADAVRFVKHEAEKRAPGAQTAQAVQAAQAAQAAQAGVSQAPRNLMAAFNAA